MAKRPSNQELCADFRALLTEGFYAVYPDTGNRNGHAHELMLDATKPWRGELWKAFREIEDRMCPLEALAREKKANDT